MKKMLLLLIVPLAACSQVSMPLSMDFGKLYVTACVDGTDAKVLLALDQKSSGITYNAGCLTKSSGIPVIGVDILAKFAQPILLDFEKMELETGTMQEFDVPLTPSIFSPSKIILKLRVRWRDYQFAINTLSELQIAMKYAKKINFLTGYSIAVNNGSARIYKGIGAGVNGRDYGSRIVISRNGDNFIGTSFITGFDWLIDFGKKTVRIRKNNLSLAEPISTEFNSE